MARIVVTTDAGATLLNEQVEPVHLESEQSAIQLLDRLEWAIREAGRRRRPGRRRRLSPVPASDTRDGSYLSPGIGG